MHASFGDTSFGGKTFGDIWWQNIWSRVRAYTYYIIYIYIYIYTYIYIHLCTCIYMYTAECSRDVKRCWEIGHRSTSPVCESSEKQMDRSDSSDMFNVFESFWMCVVQCSGGLVHDGGSAFGFICALCIYKHVFEVTSPKDRSEYLGIVCSLCSVAGLHCFVARSQRSSLSQNYKRLRQSKCVQSI